MTERPTPKIRAPALGNEGMFDSYVALTEALLGDVTGTCLLDGRLACVGQRGQLRVQPLTAWLQGLGWSEPAAAPRRPCAMRSDSGRWVTVLPLATSDGALLGVLAIEQAGQGHAGSERQAQALAHKIKPVLDCLHRELAARRPARKTLQTLTERTAELEWLFEVTSDLKGSSDEQHMLEALLCAATERLKSVLGVLVVPDKRLCIEHVTESGCADALREAWSQARQGLLTWVQRQRRPLVVNGGTRVPQQIARCKILCVPILRESGGVTGALAFFNPPQAPDYQSRHIFLARHLGRQTAGVVEAQFDLMTGLYTREGLEQMFSHLDATPGQLERSVLYVDVDHMHVVNELHGFELGNELIVRIADLLSPPRLPEGALAGRISGDRFAVILPQSRPQAALEVAEGLQAAVRRLVIGPAQQPIQVSVSCGVAALVSMPQGLARALATAELACKTAKKRGRDRVELYASADASMIRRHDDVLAVGQLREAFKSGRWMLFAQRIAPLRDRALPGGYEILLRLRDADGGVVAPGPLIGAAERYQLLPSIDRRVAQRAIRMLAPYRGLLESSGISLSINVSGQSVGSDEYAQQLAADLQAAQLPAGSLRLEITEQAAVASLARAGEMIRLLARWGCRFALDDFGTGSNSLTYLKALPIDRVKIDGSFVRDVLTNPRSEATVKAIVELARGYSIETVAEYVESEAIAAKLRALGVDYAQGYAIGRPEPLDETLKSLAEDESRRTRRLLLEL